MLYIIPSILIGFFVVAYLKNEIKEMIYYDEDEAMKEFSIKYKDNRKWKNNNEIFL